MARFAPSGSGKTPGRRKKATCNGHRPSDNPGNPKNGAPRSGDSKGAVWVTFAGIWVRLGYAHVANNRYTGWLMYAIGGSANPTILSEGNYFMAPNRVDSKQVTKREVKKGWSNWKWRSSKDKFLNGAYFIPSGYGNCAPYYTKSQSFPVADGSRVPALTADAGPLRCSSYSSKC
nr:putative pectate lyase 2 [Ipomoea batatas]